MADARAATSISNDAATEDRACRRLGAHDGVRGTCVLVMIAVHTFAIYASVDVQTSGAVHGILVVGKASSVFVVCLGISLAFARDIRFGTTLRRGARLAALGYGLNVLKFLPPIAIFRTFPEDLVRDVGVDPGGPGVLGHFLALGDILQFAGIATVIAAAVRYGARRYELPLARAFYALAAAFGWLAPWFSAALPRPSGELARTFVALFLGDELRAFFPVVPWLTFALLGAGMGEELMAERAKWGVAKMPRAAWAVRGVCLAAIGAGTYAVLTRPDGTLLASSPALRNYLIGEIFYRGGVLITIGLSGFCFLVFAFAGVLWPVLPRVIQRVMAYASRRITWLYAFSWIVLTWSVGRVGYLRVSDPRLLAGLLVAVFVATFALDTAAQTISMLAARRREARVRLSARG